MFGRTALFLFCAILGGLITGNVAQDTTTIDPNCQEPWKVTVSPELVVTWSGINRTATVDADYLAIDPPSKQKCIRNLATPNNPFNDYEISLPGSKKPCPGTRYNVTVTLRCDAVDVVVVVRQVAVPPEDLIQVQNVVEGLVTDETIEIKWDPVKIHGRPDISYAVQWHALDDVLFTEDNITKTSYTITKLSSYQNYSVKVGAHSGQDTGNWSDELIVRTETGIPSEPQNLSISSDSTTLFIKWDDPSPFRGPILTYTVQWREQKVNATKKYRYYNTSSNNFVVGDLVPLTTYFVKVRAHTEAGRGSATNITLGITQRPIAPENFHTTEISSRGIKLSWEEPSIYVGRGIIVAYSVQWTNIETNKSDSDNTTDAAFEIIDLHPFTYYKVQVCALTEKGSGDWTNLLELQTGIGEPDPPENLHMVSLIGRSIEVAWNEPSLYAGRGLITAYSIEWNPLELNLSSIANTKNMSYTIDNLHPLSNYSVRICAWTENGASEWTEPLLAETEIGIPGPPESFSETLKTPRTIEITWSEPLLYSGRGLISIYSVHWTNVDINYGKTENTTELEYKIEGLFPFSNYTVQAQAWTRNGAGEWTDLLEIRTEIGVPPAPENLNTTNVTDTSIAVSWDVPKEYQSLVINNTIKWRWRPFYFFEEKSENTTNSEYVIRNLYPVEEYEIFVRSWTKDGPGNWSESINVSTAVGVPSVPRKVNIFDIRPTSMYIRWYDPLPYVGPIELFFVKWGAVGSDHIENNVTTKNRLKLDEASVASVPSVPRNLTEVGTTTNTTIKVEWKEPMPYNGPIDHYLIRWINLNNGLFRNATTKSLEYVIKNLNPFTNHSIEVCAVTEAGYGDWTEWLVVRTGIGVPSAPTALRLQKHTDSALVLEWKEPEPIVGIIHYYVLQCNNTVTGAQRNMKPGDTSTAVTGLDPYTEYSVRVSAVTSAGQGNWSETRIFRTASGIPGLPENVRHLNVTNSTIELRWESPKQFKGPITLYSILWTNTLSRQRRLLNSNGMKYLIRGLDADVGYSIVVRARTETGHGNWTDPINVRTAIGIPTAPRGITTTHKTAWSIKISWNIPDPANGPLVNYEVTWGVLGSAESYSNFTNDTFFEAENIMPYTEYSFEVSAATVEGYGPKSKPLIVLTDMTVPSAPLNLNLTSSTNASISVQWEEPIPTNGPILGYFIRWEKTLDSKDNKSSLFNQTASLNYEIVDLDPYTNYSIKISAKTKAGYGPWSEYLIASTLTAIPKAATFSLVEEESSRSISVKWYTQNPYPGPTNFTLEVWRKPGQCEESRDDFLEKLLEGNKASDDWEGVRTEIVEGLIPYSMYYVKIVLVTSAGDSESENSAVVRTLPESPEAPTNVRANCRQSSTEAEVIWKPPKRPNGKIIEYIVKYGVENFDFEKMNVAPTSRCREHRVLLKNLRPEKNYIILVQARTEGITKVGEEGHIEGYCELPAGVPPMGKTENIRAEGSSSSQLAFEWSQEVFSDTMGSLMNYAIIIGFPEAVGNATSGRSSEPLPPWANFSAGVSSFYQATPQEWNPFDKEKDDPLNCETFRTDDGVEIRVLLRCTVGSKGYCPSDDSYCNGPLTPDTQYGLKIRAFTRGGFSETEPIYAKTGPVSGSSLVGALVGGFMFLLIISAFVVGTFVLKRKGKLDELRLVVISRFRPQPTAPTLSESRPVSAQVVQLEPYPAVRQLKSDNFIEHVRIMMSDSHLRFSQEFEALKRDSPKCPCTVAEMEENRSKNRWLNIFPYDHSRVKLLPLGDDPASDFINANYIPGYSSLREYIACQGPLPGTVDDMWRMVWEQGTTMIVMLTQCVERGKTKCERYWPAVPGEAAFYGDVQVKTLSESMLSSYVIRVFHLQLGSQTRMVKQMHFTHWPDFGCPESPGDLINFIRAVRDHLARIRPGPIIVHCSAGVGRTGTFITVDQLSQQIRHSDVIDIYSNVMELRHHRVNMVQTEDQYIYIHLCVKQLLEEMTEAEEDEYEEAIYSNVRKEKDTGV
ncbi:hypothetical protein JTE90_023191 [Oedothorax gibbosus]|uniref:protein-tyrosine-phosphatase n=1 Tax=Oedothorax gibbosus TaxID=931172 RepID=A0AAV6UG28_9ARAC|nr:hypothetical protein JTE90_023191 [Oedothorax gibbosus]